MIKNTKSIDIVRFISQKHDEITTLKLRHVYGTRIEDGFFYCVTTYDSGTWKIPISTIISIYEFFEEEKEEGENEEE